MHLHCMTLVCLICRVGGAMFRSELDLLFNYPGCCNVRRMMSSFKSLPFREQVPIYICQKLYSYLHKSNILDPTILSIITVKYFIRDFFWVHEAVSSNFPKSDRSGISLLEKVACGARVPIFNEIDNRV